MRARRGARGAGLALLVLCVPACSGSAASAGSHAERATIVTGPGSVVVADWSRTIRVGTRAALVHATHRDAGPTQISYGWAEVLERAPAGCRLPIPVLTRAEFTEETQHGQWPGEQVNLKPGDVIGETLYETLAARCEGTLTLSLNMKPAGRSSRIRRQVLTLNVGRDSQSPSY